MTVERVITVLVGIISPENIDWRWNKWLNISIAKSC